MNEDQRLGADTGFISNGMDDDFDFKIASDNAPEVDMFSTSLKQQLLRDSSPVSSKTVSENHHAQSLRLLSPSEPFTMRFRSRTEECLFRQRHSLKFYAQGMYLNAFMAVGCPLMAIFSDIQGTGESNVYVDQANLYVLLCTVAFLVSLAGLRLKPELMQSCMTLTALATSFAIIIYNRYRGEFSEYPFSRSSMCSDAMGSLPGSCKESLKFENTVNSFTVITTFLSANMFLLQAGYKLLFLQSLAVVVLTVFLCLWLLPWHLLIHDGVAFLRVALVEILMLATSVIILRSCELSDRLEFIIWKSMNDRHEEQEKDIAKLTSVSGIWCIALRAWCIV
jgi:hypothetical protein